MLWKELILNEELVSYLLDNGIKQKFITPWQGRFYERLLGLVKRCLQKGIGSRRFVLNQFAVILAEVEAVINMRPLQEFQFWLTLSHFLNSIFSFDDSKVDYYPSNDSITASLDNWKRIKYSGEHILEHVEK